MQAEDQTVLSRTLGDNEGHLTISQAQEIAKKMNKSGDSMTFDLVGPTGRRKCKWLDPFLGFFKVEGLDGFSRVKDALMYHDLWVENLDWSVAK